MNVPIVNPNVPMMIQPNPTEPVIPVQPNPTDPVIPVQPNPTEPVIPVQPNPTGNIRPLETSEPSSNPTEVFEERNSNDGPEEQDDEEDDEEEDDEEEDDEEEDDEEEDEEEDDEEEDEEEDDDEEDEEEQEDQEEQEEEEEYDDEEEEEEEYDDEEANESAYLSNNRTYYVTVDDIVENDLSSLDDSTEYQVHLCLFRVNTDSNTKTDSITNTNQHPYLTYYLVMNKTEEYAFPSYTFQLSNIHPPLSPRTVQQKTGGNESWHQFEAEFKDTLLDTLHKIKCFQIPGDLSLDALFKGFVLQPPVKYELPTLYIVLDMTYIPLQSNTDLLEMEHDSFVQATPYEILCSHEVRKTKVEGTVTAFFEKTAQTTLDFHHVQNRDKSYVESPYVLYLCKNESECYSEEEAAKQWFFPRIQHEVFGDILLFRSKPDTKRCQRYIVFAPEKNTMFSESEIVSLDANSTIENITCFSFMKNDVQYWVVHSSANVSFAL